MKFGNEFWLILFLEYIIPNLFAVQVRFQSTQLRPGQILVYILDQVGFQFTELLVNILDQVRFYCSLHILGHLRRFYSTAKTRSDSSLQLRPGQILLVFTFKQAHEKYILQLTTRSSGSSLSLQARRIIKTEVNQTRFQLRTIFFVFYFFSLLMWFFTGTKLIYSGRLR